MSEAHAAVAAAGPVLVHSGQYALWRTPAGGLHISFRRLAAADEATGEVLVIEGAPDEHLPEIPPIAVAMIEKMMTTGERPSPVAILKAMMAGQ
jgi:hypothetical protein